MAQKSKYTYWTYREAQRLRASIAKHTTPGGRIQWRGVKRDFPDRTLQQIKSYYSNVLRLQADVHPRNMPRMSISQQAKFVVHLIANDLDFDAANQSYPECEVEYLQAIARRWKLFYCSVLCILPAVLRDPNSVLQLDPKALCQLDRFLCAIT